MRSVIFFALFSLLLALVFFGSRRPLEIRSPAGIEDELVQGIPKLAITEEETKVTAEDKAPLQNAPAHQELIIEKAEPKGGPALVIEPIYPDRKNQE